MRFNNRCYGLVIIKSENSNWNADFSGFPRRLPDDDATIYGTDKAFKYAVRKYFVDSGETVFVWKTFTGFEEKDKKGKKKDTKIMVPRKLEERFKFMKEKLGVEGDEKKDNSVIFDVFSKCLDVKLFGMTYAVGEANLSLTGPLQISYGVNKLDQNQVYSNQILSPYRVDGPKKKSGDEEESDEARGSTLGSQTKALCSYYAYDFVLNPKNISDHMEDLFEKEKVFDGMRLTHDDIAKLKTALNRSASNLNTAAKIGNENVMTLFVTMEEGKQLQVPALKNLVSIRRENGSAAIDMAQIKTLLGNYDCKLDIELFKNDHVCPVTGHGGETDNWAVKDILD